MLYPVGSGTVLDVVHEGSRFAEMRRVATKKKLINDVAVCV
jgi:hypothetical protein